jgi:hypothetical protein
MHTIYDVILDVIKPDQYVTFIVEKNKVSTY